MKGDSKAGIQNRRSLFWGSKQQITFPDGLHSRTFPDGLHSRTVPDGLHSRTGCTASPLNSIDTLQLCTASRMKKINGRPVLSLCTRILLPVSTSLASPSCPLQPIQVIQNFSEKNNPKIVWKTGSKVSSLVFSPLFPLSWLGSNKLVRPGPSHHRQLQIHTNYTYYISVNTNEMPGCKTRERTDHACFASCGNARACYMVETQLTYSLINSRMLPEHAIFHFLNNS